MPDPVSLISGGVSITQGILGFLGYIRGIASSDVISAHFNSHGERFHGSAKIAIEKIPDEVTPAVWWFSVKPVPDYTFVRMPVAPSGIQELLGQVSGDQNPDYRYWRWVALPKPNVIRTGDHNPPNAKVDFIVVGYKAEAVVKHFSGE